MNTTTSCLTAFGEVMTIIKESRTFGKNAENLNGGINIICSIATVAVYIHNFVLDLAIVSVSYNVLWIF